MTSQESVATRIDTRWTSGRYGVNQVVRQSAQKQQLREDSNKPMFVGSMSPKEREQVHLSMQGYRQGAERQTSDTALDPRCQDRQPEIHSTQVREYFQRIME